MISLFNNNCRYLNDILTVNNPNFLTFILRNLHWIRLTSCPSLAALTRASTTKEAIFFPYRLFFHFLNGNVPLVHHMAFTFWFFLHVSDFNELNLVIAETVLHQWYRFHKFLKTFTIVRLTSINLQKKNLKNPVFKSTFIFLDVYYYMIYTNSDN